ncbi:immunoglobulin kappa light chain-like [Mustelus asterias]
MLRSTSELQRDSSSLQENRTELTDSQLLLVPFSSLVKIKHLALEFKSDETNEMMPLGTQTVKLCVLLYFFLTAVGGKNLSVFQTPSEIRVLKGGTARINCSYSNTVEQWRIMWKRNTSAKPLCQRIENAKNSTSIVHCTKRNYITDAPSAKSSSLIITDLHFNDSDIYSCEVAYEIPPPQQMEKGKGTSITVEASPTVQLRAETLPYPHEGIQLICISLEFYPENIQVSWFQDGQLITNGTKNGRLCANTDGSFSIISFLNLSLFDWNEGRNYSCQVNHSTLSTPITERISAPNEGPPSDNLFWISPTVSCLIALMVFVIIAVFWACLIAKKMVSSTKESAVPDSGQSGREQPNTDDTVIYSLLGPELSYHI